MRGKSTLQDADVSGKIGVDRFDLKSWQGLTEVLKAGKESLKPDAYAEFRNLVLQYAQHGGDAEFKKRIDDVIETFGKFEVDGVPTENPTESEALIEKEPVKPVVNPIGLRRSVQPHFDTQPVAVMSETEGHADESEDASQVENPVVEQAPEPLREPDEVVVVPKSEAVHTQEEKPTHEPNESPVEVPVPNIPVAIHSEDKKQAEPMPERVVDKKIPIQSVPVTSSAPEVTAEPETPPALPEVHKEQERVLSPLPTQSEPIQVPVIAPQDEDLPKQEEAKPEPTPVVPTPIPEPVAPIEVVHEAIVPEVEKHVPVTPSTQPEKIETTEIKRYANLDDCKKRIAEIKRSVNVHYGNPVALMGVQGGAGKIYMTALLTALKAVGPGANFGVDEAMDSLEKAFMTLMKGGVSAPEEAHRAEESVPRVQIPLAPEPPSETTAPPTPVPEPVQVSEVLSVPPLEDTIRDEQPTPIPDTITPPLSASDSTVSVETHTPPSIPPVSSSVLLTPAHMLGIDTGAQSEQTPAVLDAVTPHTEIPVVVAPQQEPELVTPPVSEPLPEKELQKEPTPEPESPISVEPSPVVISPVVVDDSVQEPVLVSTPVPETKPDGHAEPKQAEQIKKPTTPKFTPPTALSALTKEVPHVPVSVSEAEVAVAPSAEGPQAPEVKKVKAIPQSSFTQKVVEKTEPKQVTERYKFVPPEQEPALSERAISMRASFDTTDDTISAVLGSVQKSLEPLAVDSVIELTKNEPSGYDNWSATVDTILDAPIPKMSETPHEALPPRENKWVKKGIATTSDPKTLQEEHGIDTAEIMVQQSELSLPEITTALNSLLEKWSVFSGSGIFGMGPGGLEHPLYQKLSNLTMGEVMAGRWDEATPKTLKIIKQYIDAWRHEQGITYTDNETFDHYLRRVVQRILKRQNG